MFNFTGFRTKICAALIGLVSAPPVIDSLAQGDFKNAALNAKGLLVGAGLYHLRAALGHGLDRIQAKINPATPAASAP